MNPCILFKCLHGEIDIDTSLQSVNIPADDLQTKEVYLRKTTNTI